MNVQVCLQTIQNWLQCLKEWHPLQTDIKLNKSKSIEITFPMF